MNIEEALELINRADKSINDISWVDITDNYSYKKLCELFDGIENEELYEPVKQLIYAEWDLLVSKQDSRVGSINSFTSDFIAYNYDLYSDIEEVIQKIRQVRAAKAQMRSVQEKVRNQLAARNPFATLSPIMAESADPTDPDAVSPRGETGWERSIRVEREHAEAAYNSATDCEGELEDMMSGLSEQVQRVKGALQMMLGQGEITHRLYQQLLEERNALKEENQRFITELEEARETIDNMLPNNRELSELTPEQLDKEDLEAEGKKEFDQALEQATDKMDNQTVSLREIKESLLDIPDYTKQMESFNSFNLVLSRNEGWKAVSESVLTQMNEQEKAMKKLLEQAIRSNSNHGVQEEELQPFPQISSREEGERLYNELTQNHFMEGPLDSWLYGQGFVEQKPIKPQPMKWLTTKEQARIMLRTIHDNSVQQGSLKVADIERLTKQWFIYKDGKALQLAKPCEEISNKMDNLKQILRLSPTN